MRRRGLRHLMLALGLVALTAAGDHVTGKHLWHGISAFAGTLGAWYDAKRLPGFACSPNEGRPYTALSGLSLDVPACWEAEVASFMGREVHRFHDPEAKVGTVSVSVEPIASDDDRQALLAEFESLSERPGAIVDGVKKVAAGSAEQDEDDDVPTAGSTARVTGSLAEKLERGGVETESSSSLTQTAPVSASSGTTKTAAGRAARWAHTIRTRGEVGATAVSAAGSEPNDATYARSVWSWLLIGDRIAVRVVYSVRRSWIEESGVEDEFELVRELVDSIRPAS